MTLLGAYRLGERIAVGGMAEIFLARRDDADDDADGVVVKRLLPQYARDPEVVAMLAHEGRLMQRLAHPALIRVLDVCADNDTPFLVLEHVDGLPLNELMDGAVSAATALAIVRPVLSALGHVHSACDDEGEPLDVVHRDVTPHNVLVDRHGRVRLGDFGIARSSLRDARTRTGMIKGKLRYLAPEQVTGSTVDRRTDLYAVGLMLFELVAGEPFLTAATEPALIRLAEAPTVRSCGQPKLDKVLKRALARFPEGRPRDADAFLRALDKAIDDEPDSPVWGARVATTLASRPSASPTAHSESAARDAVESDEVAAKPASAEPVPAQRNLWVAAAIAAVGMVVGGAWVFAEQVPAGTPGTQPVAPTLAELPDAEEELPEPSVPPPRLTPESPLAEPVMPTAETPPAQPVGETAAQKRVRRRRAPDVVEAAPTEAPDETPEIDPDEPARADARIVLSRIEADLRRRGIRTGDLPTAQRAGLESARRSAASGRPDAGALAALEASLAAVSVDEAFVRRKLQRVDAGIRAARDRGEDVADIERRSALALQSLLEHRPEQTNTHLNAILDRL